MTAITFTAKIEIINGNPYIRVSKSRARSLHDKWHKPMPVIVQVNNKPDLPWHINMMPVGDGTFYLYLHGDIRDASNTKVGDNVTVSLAFDSEYHNGPMHPMPEWFRTPLEANTVAKRAWDALPPSRQKEVLRYFSWLKSDDAKNRNVEKAIYVLSGQPGRFMARSWKDGR